MRTKSFNQLNYPNKISSFQISNRQIANNKKKKIILTKNSIPRINIRMDSLIKETYHDIATGKLINYTQGKITDSNPIFLEYIKSIYEIYHIQNPIQKYRNLQTTQQKHKIDNLSKQKNNRTNYSFNEISLSTILKTQNRNKNENKERIKQRKTQPTQQIFNLTKSKILALKKKKNMQQQKNSIQSLRKINTYRKIEQNKEFKTNIKLERNQKSNKKDQYNQYTQIKKNLKKNSFEGKTTEILKDTNSTTSKNKLIFGTPDIKYRQSKQSQIHNQSNKIESFSLKMNEIIQNKQITPIFRYCFMCENMILEQNILTHQKNCPDFQNLYRATPQSIIKILLSKIQRIKKQIKQILSENEHNSIEKMKSSMNKWMSCVQMSYRSGNFNKQYEQSYRKLNLGFNINFFKLLQLSHKLKWFLKIRQQLKIKFQI